MTANHMGTKRFKSRLRLYLAPALLLVLAVALSIGWLILSREVEARLDVMIAEEATKGRLWSCDDRRLAGFPFRIEIECVNARVKDSGVLKREARLSRLGAVAQIYDPSLIIFEAQGPFVVSSKDQQIAVFDWSSLRSSVHANRSREPDRLSIVGKDVSLKLQYKGETQSLDMTHGELHLRIKPVDDNPSSDLEFAAKIDGLLSDIMSGPVAQIEMAGTIEQGKYFLNFKDVETLEIWRQAKGKVQLDVLKMNRGEQNVEVKGILGLDEQRKLSGQIEFFGKGLDELFKSQGLSKLSGLQASNLKIPLIFSKGLLLLGPFKIAELPPLY